MLCGVFTTAVEVHVVPNNADANANANANAKTNANAPSPPLHTLVTYQKRCACG